MSAIDGWLDEHIATYEQEQEEGWKEESRQVIVGSPT